MFPLDLATNTALSNVDNPVFSAAFYFATWLFNTVPFIVLLALTAFLVYKRYGKREALMVLFASLSAFVLAWALKLGFDIARPLHPRISDFGPSFPSGHTAVATAYFLSLLHFLRHAHNKWRRAVHIAFCIACALFVGVSRLYFGVHWLSDVIAGYVVGAFAIYLTIKLFRK